MMVARHGRSSARTRALSVVMVCCFAAGPPAALGASTKSTAAPLFPTPASARVHGTTATTTAQTTTTPVPATTAPATTTPASGAQPGTVAPTTTPTTTVPTTTVPASTTPAVGATTTTTRSTAVGVVHKPSHGTHLSTWALALAVLGALLVLGCIVWAVGRWLAVEPRWAVSLMHSLREASYRGSATWAEFSDWARLGR